PVICPISCANAAFRCHDRANHRRWGRGGIRRDMKKEKTLYVSDVFAHPTLNTQEHNYLKLLKIYCPEDLLSPDVYAYHVQHDVWCAIYRQGNCNCEPNINIEKVATNETVFRLWWNSKHRPEWTAVYRK